MRPRRLPNPLRVSFFLLVCACWVGPLAGNEVEQATVYPSYGYRTGAQWVIPMRIWVHEPRQIT